MINDYLDYLDYDFTRGNPFKEPQQLESSGESFWLISYNNVSEELLENVNVHSMLSGDAFEFNNDKQRLFTLPNKALFLLFLSQRPWILGYIDSAPSKNGRKFQKLRFSLPEEEPILDGEIEPTRGVEKLDPSTLSQFEEHILLKSFNLSFAGLINLFLQKNRENEQAKEALKNYPQTKPQKGHRAYAWETNMDSLPEYRRRGKSPSQDALASWHRMPSSGFSK